jgi:hypothetical protein
MKLIEEKVKVYVLRDLMLLLGALGVMWGIIVLLVWGGWVVWQDHKRVDRVEVWVKAQQEVIERCEDLMKPIGPGDDAWKKGKVGK